MPGKTARCFKQAVVAACKQGQQGQRFAKAGVLRFGLGGKGFKTPCLRKRKRWT
jgi:hypothetical protein